MVDGQWFMVNEILSMAGLPHQPLTIDHSFSKYRGRIGAESSSEGQADYIYTAGTGVDKCKAAFVDS